METRKNRARRGFTLIELLVVIAIIAILAAILFPVFMSAKAKARTIKCLAHGRQIGEASMMYLADYNDRFITGTGLWPPDARKEAQTYLDSITWTYDWAGVQKDWSASMMAGCRYLHLRKYVRSDDIWICPDPNTMYAKRYAFGFHQSWLPRASDNFVDGDRGFQDGNGLGRTMAEVQDCDRQGGQRNGKATAPRYMPPSKKIMWMCYALGRWACNGHVGTGSWPWVFPSYAHAKGSVFVYADGHAAYHDMGQGWAPLGYTTEDIDQRQ
jgi:prepilin-type N-terminal cleavage/methylation domain-containing protein